ncbi:cell division transport system ATP-binding protein [Desulfofundulus australicus DSM 11792]|uniref:Cell division ATP-binding protein FtsE n=1 Tax=Desulfofundulus australicus DSM 11792 TaxID=1121425 RepID=A0A1M4SBG2_9FIRM|nr:cell division ATP-binding protein FtsE [Desulfofundulus australicus]SHE29522.1 cell division transport system ATP-binding protein [Desulfofundulus australicus DSM 11792]
MIRFYGVTKVYPNGVKALDNINLHIKKGEFLFLVGPSGAGKSTLTRLIFREELPTRGQVLFNGRNVARMRSREVPYLRRRIGMVFQDFRLLPQKTVFENVAFALEVTGASSRDIKRRVPEVLKLVGLEDKAGMLPAHLSGGEQQRVGIARAIVNNPVLLIADEPTGNLDPETSWGLMELFQQINKAGTTIIMITHAREIVDAMKKRVVALESGRIVRDEEGGGYSRED